MTKLISGRVAKVRSANVSADRYDFIDLAETEPDLGLPPVAGWVLSSDLTGNRSWVDPVQAAGGIPYFANTSLVSQFAYLANVSNTVLTLNNFTTANLAEGLNLYFTNARVVSALIAGQNIIIEANGRISANLSSISGSIANITASIGNLTTADIREVSSNLYFTNARVINVVTPVLTTANVIETSSNLYFTNARVLSALVNANLKGNLSVEGTITANAFVSQGSGTGIPSISSSSNILITTPVLNINGNAVVTGRLVVSELYLGNSNLTDITTANVREVSSNLYFTNARVVSALIAGDNIVIEANGRISANSSIASLTTDNIPEGSNNLYFSNNRAINAFTAGKGISIGTTGIITSYYESPYFNTLINGTTGGNVLSTLSPIITFPASPTTDRYLVHSIHAVNMSGATALISGNILYSTGNTAIFANQIPIAVGGVLEFMKAPQLFQAGDIINLQGFDDTGVATSNLMSYILTYQNFSDDVSYVGLGQTLATSNTNILVYDSLQGYSVLESIKFVNLQNTVIPISAYWGDANGSPKAYFAYNLQLPPNSSVELLQRPKKLELYDRVFASYSNAANGSVSVFTSAKLATYYAFSSYSSNLLVYGDTFTSIFVTSETDGTVLYYTVE